MAPIELKSTDVTKSTSFPQKGVHQSLASTAAPGSVNAKDKELQGMSSMGYNVSNPRAGMVDPKVKAAANLKEQQGMPKPNLPKSEGANKKELPLKKFLDRKKKPKEYHVEMAKSETVDCESCGKTIFGQEWFFIGCICYGENHASKIWIKKSDDGVEITI